MVTEKIWWIKPLPGSWQSTAEKAVYILEKKVIFLNISQAIFGRPINKFFFGFLTLFSINPESATGNNFYSDFMFIWGARNMHAYACMRVQANVHFCRTETSWDIAGLHWGSTL